MQYLFNKTYLLLDNMFEQGITHVLISSVVQLTPTDSFAQALVSIDMGQSLLSAPSYEQAVASLQSEQQLFDIIANHHEDERLHIYASPQAYLTIMMKWYKALLLNIDASTAYTLFTLILARMRYTFGYNYAPRKLLTQDAAQQYKLLLSYLPPKDQFVELWEATVPFDLSGKGRDYFVQRCGVEFQLATYFANPNWQYKSLLEQKLRTFTKSATINMMKDLIEHIVQKALRLPGFDIYTQTVEQWAEENPQYRYLVDTKFDSDHLDYVYSTYGDNIRELFIETVQRAGFTPDLDTIDNVLMVGQNITIDQVLDVELNACPYSVLIASTTRSQVVDTYILNRLYKERRAGLTTFAQKIAL